MNRSIALTLSAAIMLAVFTACGNESPNESTVTQTASEASAPTAEAPEATEETTSSPAEETAISHTPGEFNIDDAVNDIVIDGKRYKVPTTLEELGESYRTDLESESRFKPESWGKSTASVVYDNDKVVMMAYTPRGTSNKVGRHDEIFCIDTLEQDDSTIYGLTPGEKIDSMIELWGEPTEIENEKPFTYYYYGGNADDLRRVRAYVEDGYIKHIEVLNKQN